MEVKVSLENMFADDYGTTLASMIKDEVDRAIRSEVSAAIRKSVKEHVKGLQKAIEDQIKKATPAEIARLIGALDESKSQKK